MYYNNLTINTFVFAKRYTTLNQQIRQHAKKQDYIKRNEQANLNNSNLV